MWKPDKKDFTHYAKFYGVPCYWNNETSELAGRNLFFDWVLRFMTVAHNYLVAPFDIWGLGFPIKIKEFEHEKEPTVKQEHEALPAEDAKQT